MHQTASARTHHLLLKGSGNQLPPADYHRSIVLVLEAVFPLEDCYRDLGRDEETDDLLACPQRLWL